MIAPSAASVKFAESPFLALLSPASPSLRSGPRSFKLNRSAESWPEIKASMMSCPGDT